MARVNLPLTPASSLDISARESTQNQPTESALSVLPPPAIGPTPGNTTGSEAQQLQQHDGDDVIYLLPPYARSTKIIQMKPRQQKETRTKANNPVSTDKAPEKLDSAPSLKPKPSKTKQPGPKSQSGKKTARKTAHSVIERRRRSYLNCEFDTLKNLIPTCKNREMHKLAILQASVDYIRYLEQQIKNKNPTPPSPLTLEQCGGQNLPREEPQPAFVSPVSISGATTEADEEATAVLLTLNKDRRNNTKAISNNARSISVRDLLST